MFHSPSRLHMTSSTVTALTNYAQMNVRKRYIYINWWFVFSLAAKTRLFRHLKRNVYFSKFSEWIHRWQPIFRRVAVPINVYFRVWSQVSESVCAAVYQKRASNWFSFRSDIPIKQKKEGKKERYEKKEDSLLETLKSLCDDAIVRAY